MQELFNQNIHILIWISLLFTAAQVYLRVNKIWKRKHEREVAASQSPAGLLLLFFNCILWAVYYIIQKDTESFIDTSLFFLETSAFLIISSGFFVKGQRKLGLWLSIKQALKLESKEADYLIKKFFKPANADKILDILHQIAMIDEDLDPKEKLLLSGFAKEWDLNYSPDTFNHKRKSDKNSNYIRLRNSVNSYLNSEPPREQVAQLKDMMETLINADEKVSEEEELIHSELIGLIASYLDKGNQQDHYHVLIVPQNPEQMEFIQDNLASAKKLKVSGGVAYSIGSYYSQKYADMICQQYRDLSLFTIIFNPEEDKSLRASADI